jgi:FkbM family methyltransferase
MVTVRIAGTSEVSLGATCTFDVAAPADVSWSAYLRFEAIVYPLPVVADHRGPGAVRLFPESPGVYELHVVWIADGGAQGVTVAPFAVKAGAPLSLAPRSVRVDGGFDVWAPTGWDAMHVRHYEPAALAVLAQCVAAGATAYDIGANLGLYTMPLLARVGAAGVVYAFEFNPVCVQMLHATVRGAGYGNCSIIPLALGDRDGQLDATINYGSTALGITSMSSFFASKPGSQISVACVRLDTVVDRLSLRPPGFIKIDVEGAEAMVVAGMSGTLGRCRPALLIELHGVQAARATLEQLDVFGYSIEDLDSGRRAEQSADFLQRLEDRPVQVLCRPR